MLKVWAEEFLATVTRLDPKFIALHCQEVGGKDYELSMKHVDNFVRLLMSSEELRLFDKVRIYLDEDFSSAEKFTALGNFYFIHKSIANILMWDFKAMQFVPVEGKEINSGSIEEVATMEKSKFPKDFFPECKWSRKGFLRTRWSLNGTVFDLINIHLFHDASNFVAMETFPSVYCKNRRRALEHTLDRFHSDINGTAPFFLFGDFNFRTDTQGVVKKLVEGLTAVPMLSQKCNREECTRLQYKDEESKVVLSVGKKEFIHQEHQTVFVDEDGNTWLKEYDRELESFTSRLFEFDICFAPSYPFEEDETGARCYMTTRCPAWCDRVVLSHSARELVNQNQESKPVEYGVIGPNSCMGDHKPVYLMLRLMCRAGRKTCCTTERPCSLLLLACDDAEDAESLSSSTPEPVHQSMHTSPCLPTKFHRAHSTPAVEKPVHSLTHTKCRCLSESASWQHQHRLNPARHLLRVNSHHSSSDEEWFERVNTTAALVNQSCESKSSDSAVRSSFGSVISASTFPVMLVGSNGKCDDASLLEVDQVTSDFCEAGSNVENAIVKSDLMEALSVIGSNPKPNTDNRSTENCTSPQENQKCCTLV